MPRWAVKRARKPTRAFIQKSSLLLRLIQRKRRVLEVARKAVPRRRQTTGRRPMSAS